MVNELPKQIEPSRAATIKAASQSLSNGGTSVLFFAAFLSFFLNFAMNSVLAQVRSLGLITHLMMMQLNYPAESNLFFSTIFEYVTFDLLPVEDIYGEVFIWENVPYSDQAEAIGYESRYAIDNTGSLLIYILLIVAQLMLVAIILRSCSPDRRIHKWAATKLNGFLPSSIDILSEFYLNIAFSLGINVSDFKLVDVTHAIRFSNIFAVLLAITIFISPIAIVASLVKQLKAINPTHV